MQLFEFQKLWFFPVVQLLASIYHSSGGARVAQLLEFRCPNHRFVQEKHKVHDAIFRALSAVIFKCVLHWQSGVRFTPRSRKQGG